MFLSAASAYAMSISQYFDSSGTPVSTEDHEKSGASRYGKTSQYAVPEGIELRRDIYYEYYPVFGKSFSEAVKSAEENGPFVKRLNRQTTSGIDWGAGFTFNYDYKYEVDEESHTIHATIDISDVVVKYNITITMPALLDDTALSPIEKRLWRNYFGRILEREHARAAIIRDAELREKLENDIKDIKGLAFDNASESDIERSVELSLREESAKIGQGWIRRINEGLNDYNRKTDKNLPRRRPLSPEHN